MAMYIMWNYEYMYIFGTANGIVNLTIPHSTISNLSNLIKNL